ncbi:unnamed protein product, partial [Chrysoparadoxa australica]
YTPLCPLADIPMGRVKTIDFRGEPLAVTRNLDGGAVVFKDYCPHRGASFSDTKTSDGNLVCPYHGFKFSAASGE